MGYHDFYAEHEERVWKVRSDIPADSLQYCSYDMVAECTDIFTGERQTLRCLALTPLNAMEVLAWARLGGDERPRTQSRHTRVRLRNLGGSARAEEAQG